MQGPCRSLSVPRTARFDATMAFGTVPECHPFCALQVLFCGEELSYSFVYTSEALQDEPLVQVHTLSSDWVHSLP